jgi:hypothetical protein
VTGVWLRVHNRLVFGPTRPATSRGPALSQYCYLTAQTTLTRHFGLLAVLAPACFLLLAARRKVHRTCIMSALPQISYWDLRGNVAPDPRLGKMKLQYGVRD